MESDPIAFIDHELPALYGRGMETLAEAVAQDASWSAREEDVRQAKGCARIRIESESGEERWVEVIDGEMRILRAPSVRTRTQLAISLKREVATWILEEVSSDMGDASIGWPLRAISVLSARAEKALEQENFGFELVIKRVPDLGQISLRVGVGREDVPTTPDFVATTAFDSLEDFLAGKLTPQQLLMTKTRIVGDASRAVTLALQWMQPPR